MDRIAIGCDHAAFKHKEAVKKYLIAQNYIVTDFGVDNENSADYPDFIFPTAEAVKKKQCDFGIVLCGSGIGASIVANKVKGIRCALVYEVELAKITREHNDTNILAIGATYTPLAKTLEIVKTWLNSPFSNDERHLRRINKITDYEQ